MEGITGRVGQDRPDMPWTEDTLDPELVELVKNYETENKPLLRELFSKYPDKNLITFHTRKEAEKWMMKWNFELKKTIY